jgi:uncharacterized membrane protein
VAFAVTLEVMRLGTMVKCDPKAWAHRIKARELAGERLSMVHREAWRAALKDRGGIDNTGNTP